MDKFYVVLLAHCISVLFFLQLLQYSVHHFVANFVGRIEVAATCLLITLTTFRFTKKWFLQDEIDVKMKAVLITGCDSGFGYLLAQRLDKKGFKVFASCLFPSGPGASELKTTLSKRSKVLGLDVTKQESIQNALNFVKQNLELYELWAVVNNAGVRKGFSVELSNIQDFKDCMDVNALGHVRITKAFLNLLRASKGRIVNVNSITSRIPKADIIAYCMSKHAAAGFNDCLRAELANTGIKVISIEPTLFLTPLTEEDKSMKYLEQKITENREGVMENRGKDYIENCQSFISARLRKASKDVHLAINDLERAVSCQYPESIYITCPNIFREICLKIESLLPPFIQDYVCHTVPHILCKLYR